MLRKLSNRPVAPTLSGDRQDNAEQKGDKNGKSSGGFGGGKCSGDCSGTGCGICGGSCRVNFGGGGGGGSRGGGGGGGRDSRHGVTEGKRSKAMPPPLNLGLADFNSEMCRTMLGLVLSPQPSPGVNLIKKAFKKIFKLNTVEHEYKS
jgi:hypothetical protein